jgi:hypothetical protein
MDIDFACYGWVEKENFFRNFTETSLFSSPDTASLLKSYNICQRKEKMTSMP